MDQLLYKESSFTLKESSNFPPIPLGRALQLLLHTSSQEWLQASLFSQTRSAEEPAVHALQSLKTHLTKQLRVSLNSVCLVLAEQATKKSPQQERAFDLFYWLFHQYPTEVVSKMIEILKNKDKKYKLGIVNAIDEFIPRSSCLASCD